MKKQIHKLTNPIGLLSLLLTLSVFATAQTSTFTFQGKLNDNSLAANGNYEMQFSLYDAVSGGNQVGNNIENTSVNVVNGIFTVPLDFGANAFDGADRFIEIAVRRNSGESYVTLNPRQQITSAPYAVKSDKANNADTIDGIDSANLIQEGDSRLSDARPASSIDFNSATITGVVPITNGGTGSSTQNFVDLSTDQTDIGGNKTFTGTVSGNSISSATQFNLRGIRLITAVGSSNLSVGHFTGSNDSGSNNSFFGTNAGRFNITDSSNSFFGRGAGSNNTEGFSNSFFGDFAGRFNKGNDNSFFGYRAGDFTTTGNQNVFVGNIAGINNQTGSNNTVIGSGADVFGDGLSYATAIGSDTRVFASNTIQIGRHNLDFVRIGNYGTGGNTDVCQNSLRQLSSCSSSLRYKDNIQPYLSGLDLVMKLRPVTFKWKADGREDMGLVAEETAEIDPLLTTTNDKGQIEGVKYDRVGVVLVNAVKEQQKQIEEQNKLIEKQQAEIDLMKQFICSQNPSAQFCIQREKK